MGEESGRWLKLDDYLSATGRSEGEVRESMDSGELTTKFVSGEDYLWFEPGEGSERGQGRGDQVVEGQQVLARFDGAQELAMQAERAISLVDRSLGAFMMMHKEVVEAKEQFVAEFKQSFESRKDKEQEMQGRISELELMLKDKEQEIADLKMLVEILEGQTKRRMEQEAPSYSQKATVGDMMEDQLRYITEEETMSELLKR